MKNNCPTKSKGNLQERLYALNRAMVQLFVCLLIVAASVPVNAQYQTQYANMQTPRANLCAETISNIIYIVGGQDANGNALFSLTGYNPLEDRWENALPQLQTGRKSAASVVLGDTIFVFGGRSADSLLRSVEWWKPGLEAWQPFKPLNQAREGHSAAVLNGNLYAIAGLSEIDGNLVYLADVEMYNRATDSWEVLDDWQLSEGVTGLTTAVFNDTIFTFGGFSRFGPESQATKYHPTIGFREIPDFRPARGGHSSTVDSAAIYVTGGRSASDRLLNTTQRYFPITGDWDEQDYPFEARENHETVIMGDYMCNIGGRNPASQTLSSIECIDVFGTIATVVNTSDQTPENFMLSQNYPNPFNASTSITFTVQTGSATWVELSIYDLHGRFIKSLVREIKQAGEHHISWNGLNEQNMHVASGVFFYVLRAGNFVQSKKMVLLQ